jgi:formate/nitrite transporter FocA (FNT family)
VLFAGSILTGWLMGLPAWLVEAAEGDGARTLFVVLITVGIAIAHLPHPIAGNVENLMGAFVGGVPISTYLTFLLTTVLGSAIGGAVFVGLLKYGHVARSQDGQALGSFNTTAEFED